MQIDGQTHRLNVPLREVEYLKRMRREFKVVWGRSLHTFGPAVWQLKALTKPIKSAPGYWRSKVVFAHADKAVVVAVAVALLGVGYTPKPEVCFEDFEFAKDAPPPARWPEPTPAKESPRA
jgi:hypothetical protein